MEAIKDQSACPDMATRSKLRYPLRSASKKTDEKSPTLDVSSSPASRRGRPVSSVSKSMNVIDLSAKDKSSKPPKRLSVPSTSSVSPCPPVGSISPISETQMKKSSAQGKSGTPISGTSMSVGRKKFSVLSSVSYWLSQIKLSESTSKHSISLGFFKLALESGCEPLQCMRDELKSYIGQHKVSTELGETVNELLKSYKISEDLQQLQIADSYLDEEGTKPPNEGARSSPTSARSGNLKTKSSVGAKIKTACTEKRLPTAKSMTASNRNSSKAANGSTQKKLQNPNKLDSNKVNKMGKLAMTKTACENGSLNPLPAELTQEDNKENKDEQLMKETGSNEEIQDNPTNDIAMELS